ncbi:BTAD domain-containing putative transcriptional regulator [Streptomyces sp. NPDC050256]|uniref:AfsR/SARP family transcriptional regulator n=1 Tax=unclassified Streptomyces TaxID=2593676 RepID=UPI0037AF398D
MEIRHEGRFAPLRGVKPRALLAALLLRPGNAVSLDALTEALWDGEPPRSAVANLRSYACLIRQQLPVQDDLVSLGAGYELRATGADRDHILFERLSTDGRQLLASAPDRAAGLLTDALALWSGDTAASGVERRGLLSGALAHLDEERIRTAEDLATAWLSLDEPRSALREARQVLDMQPLRVRSWSVVLSAHHLLGEHGQVSRAYDSACTAFRRELGTEPDPGLRRLHRELRAG